MKRGVGVGETRGRRRFFMPFKGKKLIKLIQQLAGKRGNEAASAIKHNKKGKSWRIVEDERDERCTVTKLS